MRRKDREVTDINQIFDIVSRCSVAHVGMIDNGKPYVVALNFGYERKDNSLVLYFHSACEGRKIDILKENPNIFVQMNCADEFVSESKENPCASSWRYNSATGEGTVEFIETPEGKTHALNCILQHLGKPEENSTFPLERLERTCVFRVYIENPTGKHHDRYKSNSA